MVVDPLPNENVQAEPPALVRRVANTIGVVDDQPAAATPPSAVLAIELIPSWFSTRAQTKPPLASSLSTKPPPLESQREATPAPGS